MFAVGHVDKTVQSLFILYFIFSFSFLILIFKKK
jgi:hypothetical protein